MNDTTGARELVSRIFEGIATRVDQFFKANNIQGGVRRGADLFSPMDEHELTKSIESYAAERERLARIDERKKCAERMCRACEKDCEPLCLGRRDCDLHAAIKEDNK